MVLDAAGLSPQSRTRVRTVEDRTREAWQPWRVESRSELTSLPCKVAFRAIFPKKSQPTSQPTVWCVLYDLRGVWQSPLYGERRDRSILFWKSLPVSDLTIVLSKFAIPLVILPLLSFAIAVVTQFVMLLLSSAVLVGSGLSVGTLGARMSFFHMSLMLLYHMLTVHGLWYAPLYGWLLLVSARAPRAPFIWAFLPPFVIWGVEKIAFNTSHFLGMLQYRLTGPEPSTTTARSGNLMEMMSALTPVQFFSTPGLWVACLVYGYLLFRSGYFPKALGVLMAIAGLSYLVNSFTLILAPAYAGTIFPILVLALIGELSLCLWLMVKGVNVPKWNEKARLVFG